MKQLIISHSKDWDGMFSAALLSIAHPDAIIHLRDYGDPEPIELMEAVDSIYLADMSLSIDTMKRFANKICYFDHHAPKLAEIEKEIGWGAFRISFICYDNSASGAKLVQSYLIPLTSGHLQCVDLVSIYDTFDKDHYDWDDAYSFQLGLKQYPMTVESAKDIIEDERISKRIGAEPLYKRIIEVGRNILCIKNNEAESAFTKSAWTTKVQGYEDKIHLILTSDMSSTFSNPILEKGLAKVVGMLNRADEGHFKLSLRVADDYNFDAAEVCRRYGGGGHVKAAGCIIDFEKFEELVRGDGAL